MPIIEFWYEFASTYSYPAAMRVERVAHDAGVKVAWRPFLLGPLFHAQQGLTDSPFNAFPVKGKYMWRDMERVCAAEGLALNRPDAFPQNGLNAARLTIVGMREGWGANFTRNVYVANFVHNQTISDLAVLAPLVTKAGGDAEHALKAMQDDDVKKALRASTDEAAAKGIFGAPSFVTSDGELFWGNDRLEHAIAWEKAHAKQKETA